MNWALIVTLAVVCCTLFLGPRTAEASTAHAKSARLFCLVPGNVCLFGGTCQPNHQCGGNSCGGLPCFREGHKCLFTSGDISYVKSATSAPL
ncbi:hypothetical protein BV898_17329 [Hypsibius exemplaris]|uniref:WAP domain-containing protein n=1 Tax=Hypsibius exemplaris TaxID=2072580 RepID=A0A9X6NH20_HYPEX|nr:hypothetical protein BV898_17329 [Hypsibius exemplaris]